MRTCAISLAVLTVLTMTGCGGSRLPSNSGVSGAYEFVVTSNITGGTTLVEANLIANGAQSSATGPSQVQILTLENKNWYVNGICPGKTPGQNSVTASVTGSNVALTFDQGGNPLPGQGVLSGTTITGNYSVTGSSCPDLTGEVSLGIPPGSDSGGFVGNQVPPLAGTFSGPLNLPDGTDNVALTLAEGADNALTVNAVVTGAADNGTYTLIGSAVGNVMFVSGSVNGQSLSLFGYFDRAGTYTGMINSILIFNSNTQAKLGLLIHQ
jgi:hypothetical protein